MNDRVRFGLGNKFVFLLGMICAITIMGTALFLWGFFDEKTPNTQINDPIKEETEQKKERKEDSRDLSKLTITALADYYANVLTHRKFYRNRGDMRTEIRKRSTKEIAQICEAFENTAYGNNLIAYAAMLGDYGSEKAIKTLGSYYNRKNLSDSVVDFGIAKAIDSNPSELSRRIFLDAFRSLKQEQMLVRISRGLARFRHDEEIADAMMQRIPGIKHDTVRADVMSSLVAVNTEQGFEFVKAIALGHRAVGPEEQRYKAAKALVYCEDITKSTSAIREILFSENLPDNMTWFCCSALKSMALSGKTEPVDVLYDLAISEKNYTPEFQAACHWLSQTKTQPAIASLQKLATTLQDPKMNAHAQEALKECKKTKSKEAFDK